MVYYVTKTLQSIHRNYKLTLFIAYNFPRSRSGIILNINIFWNHWSDCQGRGSFWISIYFGTIEAIVKVGGHFKYQYLLEPLKRLSRSGVILNINIFWNHWGDCQGREPFRISISFGTIKAIVKVGGHFEYQYLLEPLRRLSRSGVILNINIFWNHWGDCQGRGSFWISISFGTIEAIVKVEVILNINSFWNHWGDCQGRGSFWISISFGSIEAIVKVGGHFEYQYLLIPLRRLSRSRSFWISIYFDTIEAIVKVGGHFEYQYILIPLRRLSRSGSFYISISFGPIEAIVKVGSYFIYQYLLDLLRRLSRLGVILNINIFWNHWGYCQGRGSFWISISFGTIEAIVKVGGHFKYQYLLDLLRRLSRARSFWISISFDTIEAIVKVGSHFIYQYLLDLLRRLSRSSSFWISKTFGTIEAIVKVGGHFEYQYLLEPLRRLSRSGVILNINIFWTYWGDCQGRGHFEYQYLLDLLRRLSRSRSFWISISLGPIEAIVKVEVILNINIIWNHWGDCQGRGSF